MSSYNWPVVGHKKITKFLQKCLEQNRLAHAYLFSGQEHLGKTLVTENFIASILCSDYHRANNLEIKSIPCNQCAFCSQLARGIHPDVYFLKREEDKKNISVEQVRKMKEFLSLTTFLNSFKIAIIEHAEELNENAQNALLKILEEPTPKTILILQTPDFNLLLPTINSRCQLLRFYPVPDEEVYHHLINLGEKREQAKIFTALAHGKIGLAINYYKNPEIFTEYLENMKDLLAVFNLKLIDKIKIINNLLPV
ncbi:DNA polymerase III subunit delta', partial [Candidatus Falkowbacteria bacterium]|nr:DNA polymerase III subunit delta' [Candidatus Falkowbacteria bacterium]